MIQHVPFSQSALLRAATTSPEVLRGTCVALCDLWLAQIRRWPDAAPTARMAELARLMPQAITHQKRYGELRARTDRDAARRLVGSTVGMAYEGQTTITVRNVGLNGVKEKLIADLNRLGATATWSIRFADGTGHAIAGFRGLMSEGPFKRLTSHIFDPNLGEYVGAVSEAGQAIDTIFSHYVRNGEIVEVHRTTAE